ncbi:MAG: phosphatidylinositol kinase [Fibrobacter sp.]|nr:phosphatidylinositol kinase [Fibrobacter sp.]
MVILRKGLVYFKDVLAGYIEENEVGYRFYYDETYLESPSAYKISVTMPLQKEPFDSKTLHPFFDGLIPEGWILSVVIKNWKINPKDRMGLLLTVCNDCIGAVSIKEYNE